jgi:hypothetical protein
VQELAASERVLIVRLCILCVIMCCCYDTTVWSGYEATVAGLPAMCTLLLLQLRV